MNLKNVIRSPMILLLMFLVVAYSKQVMVGATLGLRLCVSSIIPALFPFMVLSSAFVGNMNENSLRLINFPLKKIFGISNYGVGAFICGIICGYPIGAKCTAELYRDKKISASEAESLIAYSNNCGPIYIIGAVGIGMLGSAKYGVLLYVLHILSASLTGIILKPFTYIKHADIHTEIKSRCFTQCICDSVLGVLNVCGFVVFFSVINALAEPLLMYLPAWLRCISFSFLEITNGIDSICSDILHLSDKLILIAASMGWSGLSVHMQVKNILKDLDLSMKKYYLARIFNFAVSLIATSIIFEKYDYAFAHIPFWILKSLFGFVALAGVIFLIITYKNKSSTI